ncbi:hypothetical protein [Bradyrhizobium erythrophlei]|uniref:Pectate lyase superfamily protein n=1 Tax=Bradyrhizobium erythrophlei TaxID=1437360 RepID=A0A1M5QSP2_9BRAD|nr:hypothetical protein [Bradyrhizobium erythrophlei]SHH17157.1 hypothetical protein SAMN05443248_3944 [Bradyrhizobium erythrophlei]
MIAPRLRKFILAGFAAISLLSSIGAALAQPAPVPALPDTERRTAYTISANTCACSVGFALFGDSNDFWNWVEVYLNGTRVNYNDATYGWTITSPSGSLGSLALPITNAVLTFTNAQTGTVQIVGARRPRRVSQFQEGAGVTARNVNQTVTDITATLREMWDKTNDVTGRALLSQPGNTVGNLPLPSFCKGMLLGFDGTTGLNPICVTPPTGTGNITLPVVNGNLACFNGTNGMLQDCGRGFPLNVASGGTGGGTASGTLLDNITGFSSTGYMQRTGPGAYSFSPTVPFTAPVITQTGTGAVSVTLDALYRNKIFTPEMFGAVCSPKGTAVGSISDSSAAIQAAINQAAAVLGATVQFGPCAYKTTLTINISSSNIALKGSGVNQTIIVHAPVGASPCFYFSAGTAILSNPAISDLSILSADTTTLKIAISLVDVSKPVVRNIVIAHYPIDGTPYRGGSGSIGIQTQGRELGKLENIEIYAEQPIQISANPNVPGTAEDMDSWVWRDLLLVGQLSSATRHVILADSGVAFYNTHFEGHQNWIGGVDGFHWISAAGVISEGLYFSGVKDEQAGASGGYTFNIQPTSTLYSLNISDSAPGVRNAIFLRNVANTLLTGVMYDPNTSTTKIGMNADVSNSIIDFRACAWITGTTATVSALTAGSANIIPTGFSAALPSSGTLSH